METLINIESEDLANYIMFKLDKIDNGFTEKELNLITEVVIDNNFNFYELLKLKKLNSIIIRNCYISKDIYNVLLKLEYLYDIYFDNCEFENILLIASLKLKSLSLINCNIDNYNFVYSLNLLEKLSIVNGIVKISDINTLSNLKYLQLSYSNILDQIDLNINFLEELYLDNTNINNFNFLNNLGNLKRISIDEKQYNDNKVLFDSLINKNILVMNENMIEFGDNNG